MGAGGSKEKAAAVEAAQRAAAEAEQRAAYEAHVAQIEAKMKETWEDGEMAGFVRGEAAGKAESQDTIIYMGFGFVVAWTTSVAAAYSRGMNRYYESIAELDKIRSQKQQEAAVMKTFESRVTEAERAMEDQRVVIAEQRVDLEASKARLTAEAERRKVAMRSAVASKRRLRQALKSQQRMAAEIATYKMGCGFGAIAFLTFLGVTFGSRLMHAMHGSHGHAPPPPPVVLIETPVPAPPAPPAAPAPSSAGTPLPPLAPIASVVTPATAAPTVPSSAAAALAAAALVAPSPLRTPILHDLKPPATPIIPAAPVSQPVISVPPKDVKNVAEHGAAATTPVAAAPAVTVVAAPAANPSETAESQIGSTSPASNDGGARNSDTVVKEATKRDEPQPNASSNLAADQCPVTVADFAPIIAVVAPPAPDQLRSDA